MAVRLRILSGVVAALAGLWSTMETAHACACCSNRGARYVAVEPISEPRLRELEQMTFDPTAALATGEADAPGERLLFGGQPGDNDGNEDDVVDAEDDLHCRERQQRDDPVKRHDITSAVGRLQQRHCR